LDLTKSSPGDATPPVAKGVARAIVTTSASQAAVIALFLVIAVSQANLLGAAGRGDVARFVNAGAFVVLYFGFGIGSAITYFVASGAAQPAGLLRSLLPSFAGTTAAVFVACALASTTSLSRFLPQGIPLAWSVVSLTLLFALTQAGAWLSAVLAARGDFGPINVTSVVVAAIGAAASMGLLLLAPDSAGAGTIIGLTVGLELIRSVMLGRAATRHLRSMPHAAAESKHVRIGFSRLLRYAGLAFLGDALLFMTYRFDMWVVDANHGAAELGRYALAVSLAQLVWIVPSATGRVLFPYAAMLGRLDGAILALRSARIALLISGAAALVGWAASQLLVPVLFGDDFADVPSLIGVLLLGIVPFSVAKVLGNYLAGVNALGANVAAAAGILVVTIILDLLLIPPLGARGAAMATAVSYSLFTLVVFAVFLRKGSLSVRAALSWRLPATYGTTRSD
jgi:O-antigen/teichoic acid export membrane protein